ncbi:MAG: NAD(+) synthase, partial [Lachnospiraceae bacterium]|nr:NAD(+) synthase [Lachnospiraceae bacterium]
MKDGFLKVAAITPDLKAADVEYNKKEIIKEIIKAHEKNVRLAVFPELCITGYTCGDLFLQDLLLKEAASALKSIRNATADKDMVVVVGLPYYLKGATYNVAAVLFDGKLLGMVPKTYIPNYSEFYEARHFSPAPEKTELYTFPELAYDTEPDSEEENWCDAFFGSKLLFQAENMPEFILGVEICEDLWSPIPPSSKHALHGATVIANLSASDETTGKDIYRRELVKNQSARLLSAYIYADAGEGESTTDLVFAGHDLIAENGTLLAETTRFKNSSVISEIDLGKLTSERRRMNTFQPETDKCYDRYVIYDSYSIIPFTFKETTGTELTRSYPKNPFVPQGEADRNRRCDEILNIQAMGLKKRLLHTGTKNAVVGISGGLDSTLALLVTVKAFDLLGLDRSGILSVTMPCFGTTDRTYKNACELTKILGATLKEVPIHEAVRLHFRDIGQDEENHDVTYENAQARQRTLILMDLANQRNGLVIGTGDMSELALGWATYNGDHMSMYGVNASVPKTLVRHLVRYYAETTEEQKLHDILMDVLDTPVSPELLPPKEGEISQKTEDIVGPYELHDFFLYFLMRFGYTPSKIYRLALHTFDGVYDKDTIKKWLTTFYRRFFSQQFKRSCLPDGPKVG